MDVTYTVIRSKRAAVRLGVFSRCWIALREWQTRGRLRARLSDLSDSELHDIGISRGEIDYVAGNRGIEPRGVLHSGPL